MQKRLYRLSFKNIRELNNISLNFNDVRNVLNTEIRTETAGRTVINSNPDLTYEIYDERKKKQINGFLSEQIIKIQKRKKVIFEAFIKNKDSLLEKKRDNKEADYLISVLDFYNFFGKENIIIEVNDSSFEDQYNEISRTIADKLYRMYEKRVENYRNIDDRDEYERICRRINSKIENQKKEIIQSYVFMKIFNYIKEKFEYEEPFLQEDREEDGRIMYERKKYLAEIPIIDSLNLDFYENTVNLDDENQIKLIEKNIIKARLEFDRSKNVILIPENLFKNGNERSKYKTVDNVPVLEQMKYADKFKTSKKEIFKKLLFEKFEEMMSDNRVTGKDESTAYYAVDIRLYNINTYRVSLLNIVKSVVFKEIIDELRPYTAGTKDKDGNTVKKSIRLNDMEKISQIAGYKKEQVEILLRNEEKKYSMEIEKKFLELERKYMKKEKNEEIRNKIKKNIRNCIEKEKEKYFQIISAAKTEIDNKLIEIDRKNEDFSLNFKIKNIRKKEKIFRKDKAVAIFLEDIYNILNLCKDSLDRDLLFIKVFMKLSEKFTFVVPLLGRYGEKISDRFVTIAFFNNMNNVNSFLENIVYNASDIHIMKDKYKIFRKSDIKMEMIFLNKIGKIERKKVTYPEYLDYKYRKKYRINKKNPFEITEKTLDVHSKMFPNAFKYHRILGENIKYLFVNINSHKELKIGSPLFKNYKSFINSMFILDGVINSGNRILRDENLGNGNEITLKNYMPDSSEFDIYMNERYIETVHYNLSVDEDTQRMETVEQRLRKILLNI